MSEPKDPGIKLFGKTIQLAQDDDVSHALEVVVVDCEETSGDQNSSNNNNNSLSSSNDSVSPTSVFDKNSASGQGSTDSKQEDGCISALLESSSKKEEESETSRSDDKPLKKPDKILPCPRCNSMATKFCYFNNYNASQPRHFCKKCQRYWTAGGTMRNVPVGAGRRKAKIPSSSSYIAIPDSPLCDSITSALTIDENSSHSPSYFQAPHWPTPWNNTLPFPAPIFVTTPYWTCATTDFSNTSSPLGKHPREGAMSLNKERVGEDKRTETKVLVPKTLRFHDPSEAAKSSIWTTLGIKNENKRTLDSGIFFRGLQSKGSQISAPSEMSSVLQANPAALSRSMTYHESVE